MKKEKEAFDYIFPSVKAQDFFANHQTGSMLTVIEGEPGVGKTTLGIEIARQFSYMRSKKSRGSVVAPYANNVFFVAMEQELNSLEQILGDFAGHFGEYERERCFYREGKDKWLRRKPDIRNGITIFFQALEDFNEPEQLVSWIADEVPRIKKECQCDCGLIIVDNANVFVPKTYAKKVPKDRDPLDRHILHIIKDKIKKSGAHLILIIEGHPERINPDIEFYADAVIRLTAPRTGHNRATNLEILKSRHRPTSPGIHRIDIKKSGFNLWPSPESIVAYSEGKKVSRTTRLAVPRLEGWDEYFGDLTVLKKQDVILISGNRNTGKSVLRRKIIESVDGGIVLRWREASLRPNRSEEIILHWSDFINPVAVAAQLLDEKDKRISGLVNAFGLDRDTITKKYDLCRDGGQLYDLAQELTSQFNEKILLVACNLYRREVTRSVRDSHELEQLNTEVDRDENKKFLLNRLLLERLFASKIKRLRRIICLPSSPDWHRNQLFFTIFKLIQKGFSEFESFGGKSDRVVALDDLAYLRDAFPAIRNDHEFIANLFALFYKLGWTVIVNSTVTMEEAESLVDVIIKLSHIHAEQSAVGMLQIHTKESRGLHPGAKVGYDPVNGRVCPELLHVFRVAPDGEASRVDVNVSLPYFCSAEIKYANQLCDDVVSIIGSEHVMLTSITSSGLEEEIVVPEPEEAEYVRSKTGGPILRKTIRSGEQLRELQRLSAYPHNDLNILLIEDCLLNSENWHQNVEELFEPLGSVDEWNDRLNIVNDEDFLIEFITNNNGQVVGIPYTIDIGVFACREAPGDAVIPGFTPETRELSLSNISHFAEIVKRNYLHKNKRNDLDTEMIVKPPFLSFTSHGLETFICFFWEFMEAVRTGKDERYYPECNLFAGGFLESLFLLRELVTEGQDSPASSTMNQNAVSWRSWYSRLSRIKDCRNYFELKSKNIEVFPITNKRNILAYRYFVIPRQAQCVELGKRLVQDFCSEQRALERLESLVGLSPYKKHYGKGYEGTTTVMPDTIATLLQDVTRKELGPDNNDKFITRNQLWKDYYGIRNQVGKRLKQALFCTSDSEMEDQLKNVRYLIKTQRDGYKTNR